MAVILRVRSFYVVVMLLTVALVCAQNRECGRNHFKCHGASQVQQCVDGVPMGPLEQCDAGFVCDPNSEWVPCVPEPEDVCCGQGFFPVKGSCSLFISCVPDGEKLVRHVVSCALDYTFSAQKGVCEPTAESSANCLEEQTTVASSTTTTTMIATPTTSLSPMTSTESSTKTTAATTTKRPSTESIKPVCSTPGHYPDPESCRHYYVCSWAAGGGVKATRTQCIANLFFDVKLNQCVYNTNCGTRKYK
ncbi:uncharacterized protein Muc18B [Cloeon dipterum]|uniref:uncharacterized protein Muc18B n=1 Tax=Cloeon dipterum TaxID=197152 RepID=UPI00321FA006